MNIRVGKSAFRLSPHLLAALLLAAMTFGMFADVLVGSSGQVVSQADQDLYKQFVHWRDYGFSQLRQGNLVLWNPHIFCGCPYFGGFQSALLYPLNWIFMILPLGPAINISVALHVYLLGLFVYMWVVRRGAAPAGGIVAAAMVMFSGAYFGHLFPGHLPHLCAMAWAPLALAAADSLFRRPALPWAMIGGAALAMQILAGHPQFFYYTSLLVALYSLLRLIKDQYRWSIVACLAVMFALAFGLSAVQLLTGMQESAQTLRGGSGLSQELAAQYSLPPENLLCLLAPGFFGDMKIVSFDNSVVYLYWGRWFIWEVQTFVGVAGLFLAIYGAIAGRGEIRRFSAVLAIVTLVLALGGYTPLFALTYKFMPLFDKFRNDSRFFFFTTLFLSMLAAAGVDAILKKEKGKLLSALSMFGVTVILLAASAFIYFSPISETQPSWWQRIMSSLVDPTCNWMSKLLTNPSFVRVAADQAAESLFIAAGTCLAIGAVLLISRRHKRTIYVLLALAVVEPFAFSRYANRPTFDLNTPELAKLREFVVSQPAEYRTLNFFYPDIAMAVGGHDLWGYDSFVFTRYVEFIYFTQGYSLDRIGLFEQNSICQPSPLLQMLRCKAVVAPIKNQLMPVFFNNPPLPRLLLMDKYRVIPNRDDIFAAMNSQLFESRTTVILESEPPIKPAPADQQGAVRLLEEGTDYMTIEVELSAPSILLITDAYSPHWRARSLAAGPQEQYQIMPADYVLRAIPLAAGRHLIRLDYVPSMFVVGKWISIVTVAIYVILIAFLSIQAALRRRHGPDNTSRVA